MIKTGKTSVFNLGQQFHSQSVLLSPIPQQFCQTKSSFCLTIQCSLNIWDSFEPGRISGSRWAEGRDFPGTPIKTKRYTISLHLLSYWGWFHAISLLSLCLNCSISDIFPLSLYSSLMPIPWLALKDRLLKVPNTHTHKSDYWNTTSQTHVGLFMSKTTDI